LLLFFQKKKILLFLKKKPQKHFHVWRCLAGQAGGRRGFAAEGAEVTRGGGFGVWSAGQPVHLCLWQRAKPCPVL
jgi:hypothetical protein